MASSLYPAGGAGGGSSGLLLFPPPACSAVSPLAPRRRWSWGNLISRAGVWWGVVSWRCEYSPILPSSSPCTSEMSFQPGAGGAELECLKVAVNQQSCLECSTCPLKCAAHDLRQAQGQDRPSSGILQKLGMRLPLGDLQVKSSLGAHGPCPLAVSAWCVPLPSLWCGGFCSQGFPIISL